MTQESQQRSTSLAAREAEVSAADLWLHYYSVGGNLEVFELEAYLHGVYPLQVWERNMIALALNELIDDLPQRRKAEFAFGPGQD